MTGNTQGNSQLPFVPSNLGDSSPSNSGDSSPSKLGDLLGHHRARVRRRVDQGEVADVLQEGQADHFSRLGGRVGVRLGDGLRDDDVGAALDESGGDPGGEEERRVGVRQALRELTFPAQELAGGSAADVELLRDLEVRDRGEGDDAAQGAGRSVRQGASAGRR